MGMFDWYEPRPEVKCPRCDSTLAGWQGKSGPCGLFEWVQGVASPPRQLVDDDCAAAIEVREATRLPDDFEIYTFCNACQTLVEALGSCERGVWIRVDLLHDVRHQLFGGRGAVRVWALVTTPAVPFTAVLACELEPGGSVGTHLQPDFPEIVICLAGAGRVTVNDSASAFSPGVTVELARGHTLAIENNSKDEPLQYLIVKAQSSVSKG